jgi:hypothetical protein
MTTPQYTLNGVKALFFLLASLAKRGEMWFISRQNRKMNHKFSSIYKRSEQLFCKDTLFKSGILPRFMYSYLY